MNTTDYMGLGLVIFIAVVTEVALFAAVGII